MSIACFCGRQPRGFALHDFTRDTFDKRDAVFCCSMDCLDIAARRDGIMDLSVDEKRAIETASPAIGEYLEGIGKTDLAQMSEGEWLGFLHHAYTHSCAEVRKLWNEAPF